MQAALSWIRDCAGQANEKVIVNGNVIELNEANFDREVLHATQPVLVEFWATSDEPLTMLTKMLRRAGVATDHGVFELKEQLVGKLSEAVFDLPYEFCGDANGRDQVVCRGNMNQKQLSVWWVKKQTLYSALIMNRPEEERTVAPRWILRLSRLDPKALQNARSLKSLDTAFGGK